MDGFLQAKDNYQKNLHKANFWAVAGKGGFLSGERLHYITTVTIRHKKKCRFCASGKTEMSGCQYK